MDQHLYVYCLWNGDCNGAAIVLYTFAEVLIKFIWIPNIPMPVVSRIRLVLVKFKNSANLPFSYKRCWFDLARNGRNGVDCFYKSQIRRIWPPSTRCPAERFQNTSQIETETQSLDIRHYKGDKRTGWLSELWHNCDNIAPRCHIICPVSFSPNDHHNFDPGLLSVYSLMLMFCWVYKVVIYPLGMVMRLTIEGASYNDPHSSVIVREGWPHSSGVILWHQGLASGHQVVMTPRPLSWMTSKSSKNASPPQTALSLWSSHRPQDQTMTTLCHWVQQIVCRV